MRMLKRENCEYHEWYEMRLKVLQEFPTVLINSEYLKEEKIGFLLLEHLEWIPHEWDQYIYEG